MPTKLTKPVTRAGTDLLGGEFGPDRNHALVITITPSSAGDLLTLRPLGTRRAETVLLVDVYRRAIRDRINRGILEKGRLSLEKKREAREAAKRLAMERKLRRESRKANKAYDSTKNQ